MAISSEKKLGPFDSSEIPSTLGFISFGSILSPTIEGVSMRVDVDENTKAVVAISFEHQGSVLQVSVFATSKSEALWPEIRSQLHDSIIQGGGKATEILTSLGESLDVVLQTTDGPKPMRFIGFDGPRWFLRGAITGLALKDATAEANMEEIFRSLVIDRGSSPLPPREPLPLRLPDGTFAPPKFDL